MELLLEVVGEEKQLLGANARYRFQASGGVIGRGTDCDWVIPDQTRQLSSRHAIISCQGNQFSITDVSTNGILVDAGILLPKNQPVAIAEGDLFIMGPLELKVAFVGNGLEDGDLEISKFSMNPATSKDSRGGLNKSDPLNKSNPMVKINQWIMEQKVNLAKQDNQQKIATSEIEPPLLSPVEVAYQPPKVLPQVLNQAKPPEACLPDNWWQDTERQAEVAGAEPDIEVADNSLPATAVANKAEDDIPLANQSAWVALNAFAEGLGVSVGAIEDAGGAEFLRHAGAITRQFMNAMVETAQARASIKNEFKLDMTLMQAQDNNPLKFSATGDQAIKQWLSNIDGFMPMNQAIDESFVDIQRHQLAMLAGMQGAFSNLMSMLSPEQLVKRFERQIRGGFSIGSKNARYWEAYCELYRESMAEDDAFDELFAESFTTAYDGQLAQLKKT